MLVLSFHLVWHVQKLVFASPRLMFLRCLAASVGLVQHAGAILAQLGEKFSVDLSLALVQVQRSAGGLPFTGGCGGNSML